MTRLCDLSNRQKLAIHLLFLFFLLWKNRILFNLQSDCTDNLQLTGTEENEALETCDQEEGYSV